MSFRRQAGRIGVTSVYREGSLLGVNVFIRVFTLQIKRKVFQVPICFFFNVLHFVKNAVVPDFFKAVCTTSVKDIRPGTF